jgi:hypothetical protein
MRADNKEEIEYQNEFFDEVLEFETEIRMRMK